MRYTDISFDPVKKTVISGNQSIKLSNTEYKWLQKEFNIGNIIAARQYIISLFKTQERDKK